MLCNDLQRICGRRHFETFMNFTTETVLSPLVGLLQGIQILMVASLAHFLKRTKKISMSGLRFSDYSDEIAKTPIFNKK